MPGRAEARIGEGGRFQVTLPGPGRYVVTLPPGRPLHIHETEYDAVLPEITYNERQVLCHALKAIEGFWHITQHMRSLGRECPEGFAASKLQDAIREGGRLADQYLCTHYDRWLTERENARRNADAQSRHPTEPGRAA